MGENVKTLQFLTVSKNNFVYQSFITNWCKKLL